MAVGRHRNRRWDFVLFQEQQRHFPSGTELCRWPEPHNLWQMRRLVLRQGSLAPRRVPQGALRRFLRLKRQNILALPRLPVGRVDCPPPPHLLRWQDNPMEKAPQHFLSGLVPRERADFQVPRGYSARWPLQNPGGWDCRIPRRRRHPLRTAHGGIWGRLDSSGCFLV